MRGSNDAQSRLSFVSPEQLVPEEHPIRHIKAIVDAALRELDPILASMYSDVGRPSIPAREPAQGLPADGALLDSQ